MIHFQYTSKEKRKTFPINLKKIKEHLHAYLNTWNLSLSVSIMTYQHSVSTVVKSSRSLKDVGRSIKTSSSSFRKKSFITTAQIPIQYESFNVKEEVTWQMNAIVSWQVALKKNNDREVKSKVSSDIWFLVMKRRQGRIQIWAEKMGEKKRKKFKQLFFLPICYSTQILCILCLSLQ